MNDNIFAPGPTPDTVRSADGKVLTRHRRAGCYCRPVMPP